MAKKNTTMNIGEAPITLNEHPFYGLKLDKDQEAFCDAIWDESFVMRKAALVRR